MAPSEKVDLWGLIQEEVCFLLLLCHPKVSYYHGGGARESRSDSQEPAGAGKLSGEQTGLPGGKCGRRHHGCAGLLRSPGALPQRPPCCGWRRDPGPQFPRPPGAARGRPPPVVPSFRQCWGGRPAVGTQLTPAAVFAAGPLWPGATALPLYYRGAPPQGGPR